MNSKVYQRQQTHPAANASTSRTGRGNYNYPGGNRTVGYKYHAQRYQDSSLAMCWDVARDVAIEVYDYAEPKVIKGLTTVRQLEIKGPQCGANIQRQRGRSRDKKRSARAGSIDSRTSSTSSREMDTDTHIEENATQLSSWSDTRTACSSDGSERSQKPRRPLKRRGRSPTFRSKSVNAADRSEEPEVVQMNPDDYIMMGPRRVVVAEPELHSYLSTEGVAESGAHAHDPRQTEGLKRGYFRQSSSGLDKEIPPPLGANNVAMNVSSRKEDPKGRAYVKPDIAPGDAYAVLNRMMTDCSLAEVSDGLHIVPPSQPRTSDIYMQEQPPSQRNSPTESDQEEFFHPTGYSPNCSRDPTASPTQVPSLAHHKTQGTDVKIVVGKGSKQEIFLHNSHVLLYISEYFSQIMEPDTSSSKHDSASGNPSWIIDFSHRKVKEWKLFYPFLEPPVKRTVSIDNRNLPILLPWFHRFQLPLLLNQCDIILSSLCFRPPPAERADISSATFSDIQDVLLMLYAGLSCDLPQTQQLGMRVIETYLSEAPFLFYSVTNGSVMRRLIILLQCFPHFQQQLWDSAIRSYLPPDLDLCFDIESAEGRDNLFQSPLFPLLLREGLTKAKVKARNRQYLRTKHQQQQQQRRRKERRSSWTAAVADDYSLKSNSILAGDSSLSGNRSIRSSSPGQLSRESPIVHLNRQPPMAHIIGQSQMEQQTTNTGEDQGGGSAFLEMPVEFGEQFWGACWHEEPRLSLEKHQRQRDRTRWLEDIVHQLKLHARQEEEQLTQRESNESASHDGDHPQENSIVPAENTQAQTQEVAQPRGLTGDVTSHHDTATGQWSPLDGSPRTKSVSDATASCQYRGSLGIHPSHGTKPPSPTSDDNRTTTTDMNSLSGGSAHTAEDSKLSNDNSRRMYKH